MCWPQETVAASARHHFLEGHEIIGIARERVKAPRDAFDAVDEQTEMDARPPRDRIPGHRSPVARRYQPSEHAEERFLRDRRRAIHRYGASAAEDCRLRGEQTVADRDSEELLLRWEPREVVGDRRAFGSPRSLRNLVDHGPLDAVRGAQRVGPTAPLCADAACVCPLRSCVDVNARAGVTNARSSGSSRSAVP
jgi:hypothetical protein